MKPLRTLILSLITLSMTALPIEATQPIEESARDFVRLLHRAEFQKAVEQFDINMKKAVPPEMLRTIWNNQLQAVGAFRGIRGTRSETLGDYHAVFVTCRFETQQLDVKAVFDNAGSVAGLFFVPPTQKAGYLTPDYVNRASFKEMDVQVGHGEWVLPGTLALPTQEGHFPAVVLVHGSGPQDRDETIGPNKPFRDLAWGLASKGIVVLRYEKRTRHHAAKLTNSADTFTVQEETIADALAAVSLLKANTHVDRDRIFLLGHSLGGMVIPRIAQKASAIAGFIMMAANARPLEDLILEQTLYQTSLTTDQATEAETKRKIAYINQQVRAIKTLDPISPSQPTILGAPPSYWFDLKEYRPTDVAKSIQRPMLILQGEKDCQVSSDKDFGKWRTALSDKKNVWFTLYPMLNHLFMKVGGMSTGAEYQQPGNVAETVVTDIAAWITTPDN